jgi:hypothetical protein
MTPERAAYHALMLSQGFWDEFDRDFSDDLDREHPLSPLTLDLTDVSSDINGVISVLLRYCREHTPDLSVVYDLVWADLCRRYNSGNLTDEDLCNLCWNLAEFAEEEWNADWDDFRTFSYHYEEYMDALHDPYYRKGRELFLAQHHDLRSALLRTPEKKTLFQRIREFLHL